MLAELTDFTFALRLAGLDVTIERTMKFLRAVADLGSLDEVQMFRVGRSTLCEEPADFDIYDDTFNWFFRQCGPLRTSWVRGGRAGRRLSALATGPDSVEPASPRPRAPERSGRGRFRR